MKRTFRAVLAFALALGFAACDGSSGSSGGKKGPAEVFADLLPDGPNMLEYGHLDFDFAADGFLAVFDHGDVATVELAGYDTLVVPVVGDYDDVSVGEYLLRVAPGKPYLTLGVNYGQLGLLLGVVEPAGEGAEKPYRLADPERSVRARIVMKEKGGYLEELARRDYQNMADSPESYPDLSPAEYANFREIATTGMGRGRLYRSSSPIDPVFSRNRRADSLAREAGVAVFVNLADTEAGARAREGFESSYYATREVVFLGLPAAFMSARFKEGFAEGLRFMAGREGPYLVHCTLGKDRAGFASAVLEALMGASGAEIRADYAKTYRNYYNVVDGVQVPLDSAQTEWFADVIENNMKSAYADVGAEIGDFGGSGLAAATELYLEKIGLEKAEIAALKSRLK